MFADKSRPRRRRAAAQADGRTRGEIISQTSVDLQFAYDSLTTSYERTKNC